MIAEYIKLEWDTKKSTSIELGPIDLQARATIVPSRATVIAHNAEICQFDGTLQADTYDLSIAFADGESYLAKFWQQSTNLGTIKSLVDIAGKAIKGEDVSQAIMPKVYDVAGAQIGELSYMTTQQPGSQSYRSYRLTMSNVTLDCYIVGVDHQTYFCMYDQTGTMVATVTKTLPVRNGKSRYTMYVASDEWCKAVIVATALIHQLEYDERDGQGLGGKSEHLITTQDGLRDKYQPDFITKVKSQETPTNWPENMPLVAEKVKESQHTIQLTLQRIGLIVFIIFFVGLLAFLFLS